MSVLVSKETKVICQGFTGAQGTFHSGTGHRLWHEDGRRRDPGQGGSTHLDLTVFDTVDQAVARPVPTPR